MTTTGNTALAIPATSELQGYPLDDNTLIAVTEQIMETGLRWLDEVNDVAAVRQEYAKAKTFAKYLEQTMRDIDAKREAKNNLSVFTIMAEWDMGGYLPEVIQHGGDRKSSSVTPNLITLADLNINPDQSSEFQKLHKQFTRKEARALCDVLCEQGAEVSRAAVMRAGKSPHVAYNTGENEWYTPAIYIDAAKRVMGGIDLDPASSFEANTVVGASMFYDMQTDGLRERWYGRVWMNPPYSSDLIGLFIKRLCEFVESGDVAEATVLVNNATETAWFQRLVKLEVAVCFPKGRVPFWKPDSASAAPLQGQAILYTGPNSDTFLEVFGEFGVVGLLK